MMPSTRSQGQSVDRYCRWSSTDQGGGPPDVALLPRRVGQSSSPDALAVPQTGPLTPSNPVDRRTLSARPLADAPPKTLKSP